MNRPTVVLAMHDGLERATFRRPHRERLEAVAEVLDWEPLATWDDPRADELLGRAEVLLTHWGCPHIGADVVDRAPTLRLVAHAGGTVKGEGLEVLDRAVLERGITVTSCAAANAAPVAEYALAAVLWAGKGVLASRERLRGHDTPGWQARGWKVGNWDLRVGLVGASLVGRRLIELLRPFRYVVSVYDPFLSAVEAASLGVEKVDDLDELCAAVDVLSIHAPLLDSTRGMVGATQLAALRDGATVVNTARAPVVDQEALTAELVVGRLDAVLDVTDPEPLPEGHVLLGLPNVVVTPHVAGSQGTELGRLAECAIAEVERFAAGEPPAHPVLLETWDRLA